MGSLWYDLVWFFIDWFECWCCVSWLVLDCGALGDGLLVVYWCLCLGCLFYFVLAFVGVCISLVCFVWFWFVVYWLLVGGGDFWCDVVVLIVCLFVFDVFYFMLVVIFGVIVLARFDSLVCLGFDFGMVYVCECFWVVICYGFE